MKADINDYRRVYDDINEILGKPTIHMGRLIGREDKPTDNTLYTLNEYTKTFIRNNDDKNLLRTILIILKPYKDNPILKETRLNLLTKYND